MKTDSKEGNRQGYFLFILFISLTALVVFLGFIYFRNFEEHYQKEVENQLTAVANLKVGEIIRWRKERLGDGNIFYNNEEFTDRVKYYFKNKNDNDTKKRIHAWMEKVQSSYDYDGIFLLDPQFKLRIALPEKYTGSNIYISQIAIDSLITDKVYFEDFYKQESDQRIFLNIIIPLHDKINNNQLVGSMLMRIDPELYLYPLINNWPIPSKSAETLILIREGHNAVFLNRLKFQKKAALDLRISLEKTALPGVKAVLGKTGIVEGMDYRGVQVIAYVRSIPNTPWFIVSKMDISEVYAPLREKQWTLAISIIILVFGFGGVIGFISKQNTNRYHKAKSLLAEELMITNKALENSNKELEQFAYVASHDLQEPLRMVSSYTQLLANRYKDKLDQDANDFIQYAVDGSSRMQKLINDLLDYSRITMQGKEYALIDTSKLLKQTILTMKDLINETSASITNDDLPGVKADESQISRVFQNLIQNALKFSKKSEMPKIHISCKKKNDFYEFAVRDNGIGIDMQYHERVFTIFQRLHSKREFPGTGIGLSICKRIIERHGGEIWFDSKENEGTTFYFTLSSLNT
ncbi:MAG: sensor histidine kinase [Bacteroidales bacterium]